LIEGKYLEGSWSLTLIR